MADVYQSHRKAEACKASTPDSNEKTAGIFLKQIALREGEYNRGTGCGKTARPGLCGGCRVTDVPTARAAVRKFYETWEKRYTYKT